MASVPYLLFSAATVAATFSVSALSAVRPVPSTDARIAIAVAGAAKDKMTRRFASTVSQELRSDPRFVLSDPAAPSAITILLPSHLGWERRLDWTQISYQARLSRENAEARNIQGSCWNWNLRACAKQIGDAAATYASESGG